MEIHLVSEYYESYGEELVNRRKIVGEREETLELVELVSGRHLYYGRLKRELIIVHFVCVILNYRYIDRVSHC